MNKLTESIRSAFLVQFDSNCFEFSWKSTLKWSFMEKNPALAQIEIELHLNFSFSVWVLA